MEQVLDGGKDAWNVFQSAHLGIGWAGFRKALRAERGRRGMHEKDLHEEENTATPGSAAPAPAAATAVQATSSPSLEAVRSRKRSASAPPDIRKPKRSTALVKYEQERKTRHWKQYTEAHKAATTELQEVSRTDKWGCSGYTAREIAEKHQLTLSPSNPDKSKLSGEAIGKRVRLGLAGQTPQRAGRKRDEDRQFVMDLLKNSAQVFQVGRSAKRRRAVMPKLSAAIASVPELAKHAKTDRQRKRLADDMRARNQSMRSAKSISTDVRRTEALTWELLTLWFDGWCAFIKRYEFLIKKTTFVNGDEVVEIDVRGEEVWWVPPERAARIINPDETHQVMSTEVEHGGKRALCIIDNELGTSTARKVLNARHVSGMYWSNGRGEIGPPHYLFDTAAESKEKERIDPRWTNNLPEPVGKFGRQNEEPRAFPSTFDLQPKGSMTKEGLDFWHTYNLKPCYPNTTLEWKLDAEGHVISGPTCVRLDGGPGRIGSSREQIEARQAEHDAGWPYYLGHANGTAAAQEMDQLYGKFKQQCSDSAERIVEEREDLAAFARRNKRPPVQVTLTNCDLGRIVNGREGDPVEHRPFCNSFGEDDVFHAWDAVGAVDRNGLVTRAALNHPKVQPPRVEENSATESGAETVSTPAIGAGSTRQQAKVAAVFEETRRNLSRLEEKGGRRDALIQVDDIMDRRKKQKRPAVVAPPSAEATRLDVLAERGVTIGNVSRYAQGYATNGPEVTRIALAQVDAAEQRQAETAQRRADSFDALQAEAGQIVADMEQAKIGFDDSRFLKGDLRTLFRYLYASTGTGGVTEQLKKGAGVWVAQLQAVGFDLFKQLIIRPQLPSKSDGDARQAPLQLPNFTQAEAPLLLTYTAAGEADSGAETSFADMFGVIDGVSLPAGFEPIQRPENLAAMLTFGSPSAEEMVGKLILFHWQDEGWAVGKILERNTDASSTLKRGRKKLVVNFSKVRYETDGAVEPHALIVEDYASSSRSQVGSWCILGEKIVIPERFCGRRGRARATDAPVTQAALTAEQPTPDALMVQAQMWTPEERAALAERLLAMP